MDLNKSTNNTEQLILDVSEADWQNEMKKGADYYHKVGVWVAIIFDPILSLNRTEAGKVKREGGFCDGSSRQSAASTASPISTVVIVPPRSADRAPLRSARATAASIRSACSGRFSE